MIDVHFHLDLRAISPENLAASMDASGIDKVVLLPALNEPFAMPPFAHAVGLPLLRRLLSSPRRLLCACGMALYAHAARPERGEFDVLGRRYPVLPAPAHDDVLAACRAYPERFVGFACADPAHDENPVHRLEAALREPGMRGVKAHPYWHGYPMAALDDTAALACERDLAMLVHLGPERPDAYRHLPERFPKLRLVYAHAGLPFYRDVCAYARTRPNVYVDLSSSAYVDARIAKLAVELAGPDKVLFGSDGPYFHTTGDRFDWSGFRGLVAGLGLSPADRRRIEHDNAAAVLGLA